MKITKGKTKRPRRVLLHGVPGVGKSTFAANAPDAVFIDCEDGLSDLDVSKGELCTSYDDVINQITWLGQNDHGYKWAVVDTIDWVERFIHKVVTNDGETPIVNVSGGFRAGYQKAASMFNRVLGGLDWLRAEKGMGILLLAHSESKSFREPGMEGYDRWSPRLEKDAREMLVEWCDEIFFANTTSLTKTEDLGFNKTRNVVIDGTQSRVMYTSSTAIAIASNRIGMPEQLPFDRNTWNVYQQQCNGEVKNG